MQRYKTRQNSTWPELAKLLGTKLVVLKKSKSAYIDWTIVNQ